MINFAIIDDNIRTLKKLSHILESIFIMHNYDANICCQTTEVDTLISYIENNHINVLILDIDLNSYLSGLEIAEQVRKNNKNCYIIFTTAHLEYGLEAYKYKTFDFICKPIESKRIEESIIRLFDDVNGPTKNFIKLGNKSTIIDENEIQYIKRDGMKLIFHTDSRDYQIYSSFTKIQNLLPENYIRCHKSFIVNINKITKVELINNIIYFNTSNNDNCDIGPKYKTEFMEVFSSYGNIK